MKRQYIVHCKSTTSVGVGKAMELTPPKGWGWKICSMWTEGIWVFVTWTRLPIFGKLPKNEFPYPYL